MVRCRGSVLMSVVYVLLIPMGLAGHLHPYMQRVMETRAMSRVDLVERYREVRGPVATAEEGFWWGEAKQWYDEENDWRSPTDDLAERAILETAMVMQTNKSVLPGGILDYHDAVLELGEQATRSERFRRAAARRYLDLYDEDEWIQEYIENWIEWPNAVPDVEDGWALLWHKMPQGAMFRVLAMHEGLLMVLDAEEDDWAGVVTRFERQLQIAATAGWEADSLMTFISFTIEANALRHLEEILESQDMPEAARQELVRLIEKETLDTSLDECIRVAEAEFLCNTDLLVHVFEGHEMAERIGEWMDFRESIMPRDFFGDAPSLFEALGMAREEFELIKQEVMEGSVELDEDVSSRRQEIRDRFFVMMSPDLLPRLRKGQLRLVERREVLLGLLAGANDDGGLLHDGEHEE